MKIIVRHCVFVCSLSTREHLQIPTFHSGVVAKKSPMEMIADVAPIEVEDTVAMCDGGASLAPELSAPLGPGAADSE